MNTQQLRDTIASAKIFPTEVLEWVKEQNLWNIWVPEAFGGLECSFTEGLQKLQQLAKIDGTLGWTVTLCSGANFFIGNLNPETAERMFQKGQQTILGGSGGLFGTAEKSENVSFFHIQMINPSLCLYNSTKSVESPMPINR